MHMTLLDGEKRPVQVYPSNHRARPDLCETEFYFDSFHEFTNAKIVAENNTHVTGLHLFSQLVRLTEKCSKGHFVCLCLLGDSLLFDVMSMTAYFLKGQSKDHVVHNNNNTLYSSFG